MQPHIHLQAMDSRDLTVARGIPLVFDEFDEFDEFDQWGLRGRARHWRTFAVPDENAVDAPSAS